MVLQSQVSRPHASRSHMVSRRRRGKRGPIVLAGAAVAVLGLGYLLYSAFSGPGDDAPPAGGTVAEQNAGEGAPAGRADEASAGQAAGGTDTGRADNSRAGMTGEPDADRRENTETARRDTTPTITIGGNSASDSRQTNTSPGGASDRSAQSASNGASSSARESEPRSQASPANRGQSATNSAGTALAGASGDLKRGISMLRDGQPVEGRRLLSRLLYNGELDAGQARAVRDALSQVNERLVFSDHVRPNDPVAESYTIQSGDYLSTIAPRFGLTHQFVQRINGIEDARRIRVGQRIKLLKGPFHARIDKSDYRMDIVLHGPDGAPLYVASYPVGLGEENSTPEGRWVVAPDRKVTNPSWRNPRTGEYFKPDDPENPIGEYWIALKGIDQNTRDRQGYGIHGTIEPDSIGSQASMGCIRLRKQDVEQVFHMLVGGDSTVLIQK